jgi:hypothetical protein
MVSISNLPRDVLNYIFRFIRSSEAVSARHIKLFHKLPELKNKKKIKKWNAISSAVKLESVSLIEWLVNNFHCYTSDVGCFAAMYGKLDILNWAIKKGYEYDTRVVINASRNGHTHILKYLLENNVVCASEKFKNGISQTVEYCRLVKKETTLVSDDDSWLEAACVYSAGGGRLEQLMWLHSLHSAFSPEEMIMASAHGHIDVLEWLFSNNCQYTIKDSHHWSRNGLVMAAKNNRIGVLGWYRSKNCEWHSFVAQTAAKHGHVESLKYLVENGCPVNAFVACAAAHAVPDIRDRTKDKLWNAKRMEMLKFLKEHGAVRFMATTCASAAQSGDLELLKWLRLQGCQWNTRVCTDAASHGHLKLLKWARENGCPWDNKVYDAAARNGHIQIIQWALDNGCPRSDNACSKAAITGKIDILEFLVNNGFVIGHDVAVTAARFGRVNVLEWLKDHNFEITEDVATEALDHHRNAVVKWLIANNCPINSEVREKCDRLIKARNTR